MITAFREAHRTDAENMRYLRWRQARKRVTWVIDRYWYTMFGALHSGLVIAPAVAAPTEAS